VWQFPMGLASLQASYVEAVRALVQSSTGALTVRGCYDVDFMMQRCRRTWGHVTKPASYAMSGQWSLHSSLATVTAFRRVGASSGFHSTRDGREWECEDPRAGAVCAFDCDCDRRATSAGECKLFACWWCCVSFMAVGGVAFRLWRSTFACLLIATSFEANCSGTGMIGEERRSRIVAESEDSALVRHWNPKHSIRSGSDRRLGRE
jgi:hypothetical protein